MWLVKIGIQIGNCVDFWLYKGGKPENLGKTVIARIKEQPIATQPTYGMGIETWTIALNEKI